MPKMRAGLQAAYRSPTEPAKAATPESIGNLKEAQGCQAGYGSTISTDTVPRAFLHVSRLPCGPPLGELPYVSGQ